MGLQVLEGNLRFKGQEARAVFVARLRGIGMSVTLALSNLDIEGRVWVCVCARTCVRAGGYLWAGEGECF